MKNFLCLWVVLGFVDQSLCEDPVNILAEPGQNVDLPCRADRNSIVTVVKLTRDDLEPRYVFLYRNEQIDKELQNPQYLDRTELQSVPTSDGEIHLTIKNVRQNDSGVYECRVKIEMKSNTRRKRSVFENTIIHLEVAAAPLPGNQDGGNQDGLVVSQSPAVLMVALTLAVVVSVFVAMVIIIVIRRKKIKTLSASPSEDAEKPPLI